MRLDLNLIEVILFIYLNLLLIQLIHCNCNLEIIIKELSRRMK